MKGFSVNHKYHEFYFYDKELKEKSERSDNEFMEIIPDRVYLYINNVEFNTIFDILGYDKNKIDFAYPEQLRTTDKTFDNRIKTGDIPFWYYGGNDQIFGAPLWRFDILYEFKEEMKKIMFESIFEKLNTNEVD